MFTEASASQRAISGALGNLSGTAGCIAELSKLQGLNNRNVVQCGLQLCC